MVSILRTPWDVIVTEVASRCLWTNCITYFTPPINAQRRQKLSSLWRRRYRMPACKAPATQHLSKRRQRRWANGRRGSSDPPQKLGPIHYPSARRRRRKKVLLGSCSCQRLLAIWTTSPPPSMLIPPREVRANGVDMGSGVRWCRRSMGGSPTPHR